MRSVDIQEARRKLNELVDAAEQGELVLITRHGKEVARIKPAGPAHGAPLPDLTAFRESIRDVIPAHGEPLSKAVVESRSQSRD